VSEKPSRKSVVRLARGALDALLDWFYPRHCYHCGASLNESALRLLCHDCLRALADGRIAGPVCDVCGLPLEGEPAPGTLCITCRTQRRYFDRARALFAYAGPAASVIKSFKFDGDFFLGPRFLRGALALGWLPGDIAPPSAVLPVPLHPRRRRERGYDQALLLARALARHFGRPLLGRALVRTRYTTQQVGLSMGRRHDNVRGAFSVRRPGAISGESLLLVDDVMTTGATVEECAKALRKAGAAEVQVFTLARTAP